MDELNLIKIMKETEYRIEKDIAKKIRRITFFFILIGFSIMAYTAYEIKEEIELLNKASEERREKK